jgi:hypothetical protein
MKPRPEVIRLTPLGQLLRLPAAALALAIVYLFVRIWGRVPITALFAESAQLAVLVGAYLLSVPAHEALHVFGFRHWGGAPAGATRIRWRGLSAFTHCAVPVRAGAYRAAVALPGFVLGVIPAAAGFVLGNAGLALYGALLMASALGDLRILVALRGVPATATVQFVGELGGYEVVRQP